MASFRNLGPCSGRSEIHRQRSCAPPCQAHRPRFGLSIIPYVPLAWSSRSSVRTHAAGDDGQAEPHDNDLVRRALEEALQLYREAERLAQDQTKHDLHQLWATEGPSTCYRTNSPDAPAGGASGGAASSTATLASFWQEQGLAPREAAVLAEELLRSGSAFANVSRLAAKLQLIERVLPAGPLACSRLVSRDLRILSLPAARLAQQVVELVDVMPPSADIIELLTQQPRLLLLDDVRATYMAVVAKLVQLHPSHRREEAEALVAEYPQLLLRMRHYMAASLPDELPIEIQNMFIVTGQGLAALHSFY